jgi:hypothetical protein
MTRFLPLTVLALGTLGGAAGAQPTRPAVPEAPESDRSFQEMQALAKAKFDAVHRTAAQRAADRLEAARNEFLASWVLFYQGGGRGVHLLPPCSLDFLMTRLSRDFEAERATVEREADLPSLLERHWRNCLLAEQVVLQKARAGAAGGAFCDVCQVRTACLLAEIAWSEACTKLGRPVASTAEGLRDVPAGDLDDEADRAKADRNAVQTQPAERARQAVAAARAEVEARFLLYQAGGVAPGVVPTLDRVLEAADRLCDTEAAVAKDDVDSVRLARTRWSNALSVESITEMKSKAGARGGGKTDLLLAHYQRLSAEADLVRTWRRTADSGAAASADDDKDAEFDFRRGLATNLKAALQTTDLERQKRILDTASQGFQESKEQYQYWHGRMMPESALEWSVRLLGAELALRPAKADREAALEAHWRRVFEIQSISAEKFGKGGMGDYRTIVYFLRQAEVWWLDGFPESAK